MAGGFSQNTKFIVFEDDEEIIKRFSDFRDGDSVFIKNMYGEKEEGTIKKVDRREVMYKYIISSKKYSKESGDFYNDDGHLYTPNGTRYGLLTNESKREKRIYAGVGYAILEKQTEVQHENDPLLKMMRANTISYSFYDFNDNLIETGLTVNEVQHLVDRLSRIDKLELKQLIDNGGVTSYGRDVSVIATPRKKWWLNTKFPELFIRTGDMLFDNTKYNSTDRTLSGYTWHIKSFTVDSAASKTPWTVEVPGTHSFQLNHGIVTGE